MTTGLANQVSARNQISGTVANIRKGAAMSVQGQTQLLMTDFGIKPPTAMLGMLTTDPKVTVSFETVLAVPLT